MTTSTLVLQKLLNASLQERVVGSQFRPSCLPICPIAVVCSYLYGEKVESNWVQDCFMDMGSAVHQTTQMWLGIANVLWGNWKCPNCKNEAKFTNQSRCSNCGTHMLYKEFEIEGPLGIRGHMDGLILDEYGVPSTLLEIKTIANTKIKKAEERIWHTYYYKSQTDTYCCILKEQYNIEIKRIWYLYVPRDYPSNCRIIERTDIDWNAMNRQAEIWQQSHQALRDGRWDWCIENKVCEHSIEAGDCPWGPLCWSPCLKENLTNMYNMWQPSEEIREQVRTAKAVRR